MRGLAVALAICLSLAGLSIHRSAHAEPSDTEAKARSLLNAGIEQVVSPHTLAQLGPELPGALLAIFMRTSEARHVRLRALSMLVRLARLVRNAPTDEPRVIELFARLVREGMAAPGAQTRDPLHPARSSLVLRRAIEGVAAHLTNASASDLVRLLAHRDATVRTAVVLALRDYGNVEVRQALIAQRTRESSPLVLEALTSRSVR